MVFFISLHIWCIVDVVSEKGTCFLWVACEKFMWFLPSILFCFMLCVFVMGVKHHSPLGGKRCLGEGVSWASKCSWEKSSMCGEDLVIICEIWISCYCIMGGIRRYGKKIDIVSLERALMISLKRALMILKICAHMWIIVWILFIVKAHLHPSIWFNGWIFV